MIETIRTQRGAQIITIIFVILTLFWISLQIFLPQKDTIYGEVFGAIYGIVALLGGIWGLKIAKKWGFWKSLLGRAIIMLSFGLLLQEFGQIVYSLYFFETPYPSIGDFGYFGSIPVYIYGIILLAQASGVKVKLKLFRQRLQAILIPLVMLSVGYYLFLQGYEFDWSKPLTIFLDFGYPFGEAIYISLAIIVYLFSRGVLGGIMHKTILIILFAFVVQFFSDYTFLYQSNNDSWYAGGINDYMYLVAYFIMSLGILQFNSVYKKLNDGN